MELKVSLTLERKILILILMIMILTLTKIRDCTSITQLPTDAVEYDKKPLCP